MRGKAARFVYNKENLILEQDLQWNSGRSQVVNFTRARILELDRHAGLQSKGSLLRNAINQHLTGINDFRQPSPAEFWKYPGQVFVKPLFPVNNEFHTRLYRAGVVLIT